MSVLAIRIDGTDPSDLLNWLDDDGGAYLVVKEVSDSNHHFHAVLHTTRKAQAIRVSLKRAIPSLNGNGSYSVADVRDLAKYQRYMMKGESLELQAEVVGAYGLLYQDLDWQDEQHAAYWDENQLLAATRHKMPVMEAVFAQAKEAGINWTNREALGKLYIKELVARDKSINLFAIRSSLNLLQIKLCPDDAAINDLAGHLVAY